MRNYLTFTQFCEAYDAEPLIYIRIASDLTGSPIYEEWAGLYTSTIIEDAGGDYTAIGAGLEQIGQLIEVCGASIEASRVNVILDGLRFNTSILGYYVDFWIGAPELTTDEHVRLYRGQITNEQRTINKLVINVEEQTFYKLQRTIFPRWKIRDEHDAPAGTITAPPDESLDTFVPLVFGQLSSAGTGALGRLRCIPITKVDGGDNDFLVCQTEFGASYSIDAIWQNGISKTVVASEVDGVAFDYIKVTLSNSSYTDLVTVDVTRLTMFPIDELKNFLTNQIGLSVTDNLDTTSFTTAQAIAASRGYVLGGKIYEQQNGLEIVRSWLASFAAEMKTSGGKWGVRIRNYDIDTTAPDFTEDSHMIFNTPTTTRDITSIINAVSYEGGYDFDNNPLFIGVKSDASSIVTWGRLERQYVLPFAGNLPTANDVALRAVTDYKEPRQTINFTTFLKALSYSVMDTIRITTQLLFRAYAEIRRRTLTATGSVDIEALDITDISASGFHLGAEQDRSTPVDVRNCSVTSSMTDGGTIELTAGGDIVTGAGTTFQTLGVKVGDFLTVFQLAAGETPNNLGVYEVIEAGKVIGDPITSETVFHVVEPNSNGVVIFATAAGGGNETIVVWWIARSWATANADQKLMGFIADGTGHYSDGTDGKVLV